MEPSLVLALINLVVVPLAGTVSYLLWNKITTIEKEQVDMADRIWAELRTVQQEISTVRLNYLDRFDDLKDIMNKHHLLITEKITILETLLKQNLK
jgi:hypothetical protein